MVSLGIASTLAETFGIGMFLPIFEFMRLEGDIGALTGSSRIWKILVEAFATIGLGTTLVTLLAAAFMLFMLRQLFIYVRLLYLNHVQLRMAKTLRDDMFRSYLAAETNLHDSLSSGDMVNAMTTETQRAAAGALAPVHLIAYILVALAYLVFLALLSPLITAVALSIFALAALLMHRLVSWTRDVGREITQSNASMSSFLVERLRAARLTRLCGTQAAEAEEMGRHTQAQFKHNLRAAVLQGRAEVMLEPVAVGLSCAFLYFAANHLGMQVEEIGLYLVISMRLIPVTKAIIQQRQLVLLGAGAVDLVSKRISELTAAREIDGGRREFVKLEQGIHLDGIGFTYANADRPALDDVTVTFRAGTVTALVGPSGSGKSTLIDLLPRLRRPQKGQVLVDGTPIGDYTLASLRMGIAYVPQAPQITNVTVARHIGYGRPNATMKDVEEAAGMAGALDFIRRLPEGFDTLLGEGGASLSGGQRQRLDLARALVRRAPILIMDEPTSQLDADSEEAFRQTLGRIAGCGDTTVIVVGHRLSTVAAADNIVVLIGGHVDSQGTHTELLAANGWYAQAFRKQQTTDHGATSPAA